MCALCWINKIKTIPLFAVILFFPLLNYSSPLMAYFFFIISFSFHASNLSLQYVLEHLVRLLHLVYLASFSVLWIASMLSMLIKFEFDKAKTNISMLYAYHIHISFLPAITLSLIIESTTHTSWRDTLVPSEATVVYCHTLQFLSYVFFHNRFRANW